MGSLQATVKAQTSRGRTAEVHEQHQQQPQQHNPTILTHAIIPTLVTHLDASDVLECYYLTRQTQLTRLHNTTITKGAIGLRQKKQLTYSTSERRKGHTRERPPLQLTLEYGPSLDVSQLPVVSESIPRVIWDEQPDSTNIPVAVSWENEGRVYYTTDPIGHGPYTTANYLASVSGAVVNRLLEAAVDYTTSHARVRRYQPFTVVRDEQQVVRSSSDVDFILHLYDQLATLGVALEPILTPPHRQLRLHTQSSKIAEASNQKTWKFVQIGKDVPTRQVADFYAKLATCLEALVTADTSVYGGATATNNNKPNTTTKVLPTAAPTMGQPRRIMLQNNDTATGMPPVVDATGSPPADGTNTTTSTPTAAPTHMPTTTSTADPTSSSTTQSSSSSSPTIFPTDTDAPTRAPTTAKSESEQAAQAAADAQQAANDAEEAGNKPAAEAAQAAADAAQRAADVTATQQALMHQKALLSGDADSMAATVAICFSDPAYGIAPLDDTPDDQTNNQTTPNKVLQPTTAYLYWDGTFYLQLELVPPYLSVAPLNYRMPQVPGSTGVRRDDFVDWSLALLIAAMSAVGLLLLIQQVSGRNFHIIRPLYRLQRWFFDPTHFDSPTMEDFSETAGRAPGLGREYTFGEDVIPLSMGGRRGVPTNGSKQNGMKHHSPGGFVSSLMGSNNGGKYHNVVQDDSSGGDVELMTRVSSSHTPRRDNTSLAAGGGGNSSNHSMSSIEDADLSFEDTVYATGMENRFFRDPDLVDLPNLSSTSKVAVPVRMTVRRAGSGTDRSFHDDDDDDDEDL